MADKAQNGQPTIFFLGGGGGGGGRAVTHVHIIVAGE